MSSASGGLDLDALRRAIESRDPAALTALYASDADLVLIDRDHPPSHPTHLHGARELRGMFDELCGREMSHHVTHAVASPGAIAYTEMCTYPDGTQVFSANVCDVRDGRIFHHEMVQAWDEAG